MGNNLVEVYAYRDSTWAVIELINAETSDLLWQREIDKESFFTPFPSTDGFFIVMSEIPA
jgi:hypothetical protein